MLLSLLWLTGSAWGQIDCTTVRHCQYLDDTTGAYQPAVSFQVAQDGPVHVVAQIFDGGCGIGHDLIDRVKGDLDLVTGYNIVYLNFNPPLDPGFTLGVQWDADPCERPTIWPYGCVEYTIGDSPAVCAAGGAEEAAVAGLAVANPVQKK